MVSDIGILGKRRSEFTPAGVESVTFLLLVRMPLSYRRLVETKAIKLGSRDKHKSSVAQW